MLEARETLHFGENEYLDEQEFDEVVETAKDLLEQERDEEYDEWTFLRTIEYNEYMKSINWSIKRGERLAIDNWICQDCGLKAEQVHHITYKRFKREKMEDLVSLCVECHKKRHRGQRQ